MKFLDHFQQRYGALPAETLQPTAGTYRALLDADKERAVEIYGWTAAYAESTCRHGIVYREALSRLSEDDRVSEFYAEKPTQKMWEAMCQVAREMHTEIGGMENYSPHA